MQPQYQYQYQYPPQYPQQPAQATVMPGYPQYPAAPQYPPQYPVQPAYAPPPPPPTAPGSLDAFFEQPSTGSKSWVFKDRPIGTTYSGIVARAVTNADIRQQTDQQGKGQTYKDGRPKFVMVVPMLVAPSAEYPEGQASWWVKGQARDELARAMSEAGAPEGPPEPGAGITVTMTGMRPIPGFNPAYQYRVTYVRPTGAPAVPAPAALNGPPANQWQAPPPQQPAYAPQPQPGYVPGMEGQPIPALNIGPTVTPPAAPQAPAAPMAATNLTPEQQALLAKLTGQPQG